MPEIIAIASGKGGVGKTNISVNLAIQLARKGNKICLFDADLGLANINILLGLTPENTLEEVLNGEKDLNEILIRHKDGIDIIPGSSGVEALADLDEAGLENIVNPLSELEDYDYIFFDTSAGISRNVIAFCMASTEIILTIVPEPTSFTDSYSLLKVLCQNGFKKKVNIVINRCKSKEIAKKIFSKFKETVIRYLNVELHYMGAVTEDYHIPEAVTGQSPFIELFPDTSASSCIRDLAQQLSQTNKEDNRITMDAFWLSFKDLMKKPISVNGPVKKKTPQKNSPISEKQKKDHVPFQRDENKEFSNHIVKALNTLVETTNAISMEITRLKKTIEKSGELPQIQDEEKAVSEETPPAIMLDFEKFLNKRKNR